MATDYIRLLPTHHLMSNTSNLVNRLNLRKAQPQATRHVAFGRLEMRSTGDMVRAGPLYMPTCISRAKSHVLPPERSSGFP